MPSGKCHSLCSILPFFSTPRVKRTPGSSIAFARSRAAMSAVTILGVSKYLGSGQKRMRVPDSRGAAGPIFFSGSFTLPLSANTSRWRAPSRLTSTSSRVASALVTQMPTPCRPPAMR